VGGVTDVGSDSASKPRRIALAAGSEHGMELPDDGGGATYWANTYSAFERLSPIERDRLMGLRVVREGRGESRYHYSVHPLVVTNLDSSYRG
jgi:alpha-ketoglutarate-dependent taurine dioxygenase